MTFGTVSSAVVCTCVFCGKVGHLERPTTMCDSLGHTLCKEPLVPNFRYRDCCFLVGIPLMVIFLMGVSTTPNLMKAPIGFICVILIVGLPRMILFRVEWFVENGVLVCQLSH